MNQYKTEQEKFWAGEFGNQYIQRNQEEIILASSISLFSTILRKIAKVQSFIEFGCNIGINLRAIDQLFPGCELSGIEINGNAVEEMEKWGRAKVYHNSILDFTVDIQRDFVFTRGLLILINPEYLPQVYKQMYETSKRYICVAEYYNPTPVEISYRGHQKKLYKRDFAGELMQLYPDLELIDYGFVYHNDRNFPQDDITWFLLEKK